MSLRQIALLFPFLAVVLPPVAAGEITDIPEVGVHHPILTVEKSVNPQNLMVVYTKIDANGHFVADTAERDRPEFDFYWLMSGKDYKPVNWMIKKEIRRRFECQSRLADRPTHFVIHMNDLKEVDSDIEEAKVDVYATGIDGARDVEARMTLGPSDGNMRIRLFSIYTEGRAFPPAIFSVTLKGEEIVNGRPTGKRVARKYDAKR